jgi:glycosyltransferase involved in cell wall biosynthesis
MNKSICFISRTAHFVLFNETEKLIGGAEFQQVVLAKALRKRGWRVSFITEKYGNITSTEADGITVFPVIDYKSGNRYVRRTVSIPFQLWKAMRIADAHFYYHRNPGPFTAVIGLCCKAAGKKFILAGANDANFDRKNELNVKYFLDVLEIKYGIKLAEKIILQNKKQKYLLKKHYGRDGLIFHNLYDPPTSIDRLPDLSRSTDKPRLLWVGRLARQKRPELCLKLAERLPDFEIIIVGSRTLEHELTQKFKKAVVFFKNITFTGHLPLSKVEELFDSAHAFVNTSFVEGFPNTFLQAWSRGLPVISFVDPDDLIRDFDLGIKVSNIDEMADAIRKKLNEKDTYLQQTQKIKSFFDRTFNVDQKIKIFESILLFN